MKNKRNITVWLTLLGTVISGFLTLGCMAKNNNSKTQTAMATPNHVQNGNTAEIYFAGGCFWGTEHFFKQINGVLETSAGYANGKTANPGYEEVSTDKTGFAETVKVTYNPEVVNLELLLDLFF